jgi:hypothetical protein
MRTALPLLTLLFSAGLARPLPFTPTVSLQVTTPQIVNASFGIATMKSSSIWGAPRTGLVFRVEPGLGGGKLHAGGRFAFSMFFTDIFYTELTAAVMRTWGKTWGHLERNQTYAGAELRMRVHLVTGTMGCYRHVYGSDENHNWVLSAGIGLGL